MKRLVNAYSNIKNGYSSIKEVVLCPRGKMVKEALKKLVSQNFIKFYKPYDNYYSVHLFKKNTFRNMKIIAIGGGLRHESVSNIKKYFCRRGQYTLVTTDKGLKWSFECIKQNIGGRPILYISI